MQRTEVATPCLPLTIGADPCPGGIFRLVQLAPGPPRRVAGEWADAEEHYEDARAHNEHSRWISHRSGSVPWERHAVVAPPSFTPLDFRSSGAAGEEGMGVKTSSCSSSALDRRRESATLTAMDARRRPRALAAVLMLAAMASGTAEAVAGEFADVDEHYEDALAPLHEHSGQDAGLVCVDTELDSDDQHVKGYDHCTHTHGSSARGAALPCAIEIVVPAPTLLGILARPPDAPRTGLYHPPRA